MTSSQRPATANHGGSPEDALPRTRDSSVNILALWPSVLANDVTHDELRTLLRDKLTIG